VDVAPDVAFCGRGWIYGRGKLNISSATWISPDAIFYTHEDVDISIGENCDIGHCVRFVTGSHLIGGPSRRAGQGFAAPIEIGNGCWIGAGTIILGGAKIGSGAVIAAGSLVRGAYPENSLIAGVPAKVKRALAI
jgi:maltose O-acetyltransferase